MHPLLHKQKGNTETIGCYVAYTGWRREMAQKKNTKIVKMQCTLPRVCEQCTPEWLNADRQAHKRSVKMWWECTCSLSEGSRSNAHDGCHLQLAFKTTPPHPPNTLYFTWSKTCMGVSRGFLTSDTLCPVHRVLIKKNILHERICTCEYYNQIASFMSCIPCPALHQRSNVVS